MWSWRGFCRACVSDHSVSDGCCHAATARRSNPLPGENWPANTCRWSPGGRNAERCEGERSATIASAGEMQRTLRKKHETAREERCADLRRARRPIALTIVLRTLGASHIDLGSSQGRLSLLRGEVTLLTPVRCPARSPVRTCAPRRVRLAVDRLAQRGCASTVRGRRGCRHRRPAVLAREHRGICIRNSSRRTRSGQMHRRSPRITRCDPRSIAMSWNTSCPCRHVLNAQQRTHPRQQRFEAERLGM